jgi:hypothetical protein
MKPAGRAQPMKAGASDKAGRRGRADAGNSDPRRLVKPAAGNAGRNGCSAGVKTGTGKDGRGMTGAGADAP